MNFEFHESVFKKVTSAGLNSLQQESNKKINLIFHDSTKISFVSKHQNKAEFENLVDSEVLSSDFSGLRISVASVTSTVSTTSVASMTSIASFHQKKSDPDGSMIPGTKMTNSGPFLWNGSSKTQFFTDFLNLFCQRLLRTADVTFLKTDS